jgi:hypothetical protein
MTDHPAPADPPAFYPAAAPVPETLETPEFRLRMLRATDVERDYAAVLASREHLLVRSAGRWPREGFTLEENLADLEEHEAEHHARVAFTYTVMNPAETECLGCVYINPLSRVLARFGGTASDQARVGKYAAVTSFWVTPPGRANDQDARLLDALRAWFARAWAFRWMGFICNWNEHRHLDLYAAAGLAPHFTLDIPREPFRFYIYADRVPED